MSNPSLVESSRASNSSLLPPFSPSKAAQGGPSRPATFTTALSIPVVGTRPILPSTSTSAPSNEVINTRAMAANSGHTGVYPSGPAPARMASTRMSSSMNMTTVSSNSVDDGTSDREKPPDLGIEPIKVASALDLNTVRTQAPRKPPCTEAAAAPPPGSADMEVDPPKRERLFGIEDCPEFCPTQEEWSDPTKYIRKITPAAEKYGLCKIIPPESWKMPFTTNTENFRFKTRLQRLNQVEATSRAKINFLEQIYRYHKQHGQMRVIVPTINHSTLDLWLLRKEVQKLGGFTAVTTNQKWEDVGRTLGYSAIPNVGRALKQTYEKLIVPYEKFLVHVKNSPTLTPNAAANGRAASQTPESPSAGRDSNSRSQGDLVNGDTQMTDSPRVNGTEKPKSRMGAATPAPPAAEHGDYCEICKKKEKPSEMLLCDGCDCGFHIFCLDPPLSSVPKGQWFCHSCLDGSNNDFGFEEGEDHTLATFQARDTAFRKLWFESHPPEPRDSPPTEEDETVTQVGSVTLTEYDVEKEFWKLVQSSEDTVEVEYGADIHSTTHGSAMPTIETHPLDTYSRDPWNLNNLPIISDSLLRFIKGDISGMTVPWTYVGMVFSTFCWHNEDHYTYSINYMHWGATKTWYGIPGGDAEKFEAAIRSEAPELFEAQPDLLYQLVTLMRPDRLKEAGVKVVACNQRPGEFVITFPKAYHAGFNHGFNFNEAVNFALPEWLPLGLESVLKYQRYHKAPVFSHDELLCTIAQHSPSIQTSLWLKGHLQEMHEREKRLRSEVRKKHESLALYEDRNEGTEEDQYQCLVCKSFCYLSRVTCECTPSVACLSHADSLCECDDKVRKIKVRYWEYQMSVLVADTTTCANIPYDWRLTLAKTLAESPTPAFRMLKHLAIEGDKINYPLPELANLKKCVERGELWITNVGNMLRQKKESRRKKRVKKDLSTPIDDGEGKEKTLADAEALLAEVAHLGFDAPEIAVLTSVIEQAKEFRVRASTLLERVQTNPTWEDAAFREGLYAESQDLMKLGWSISLALDEMDEVNIIVKKLELMAQLDSLQEDSLTLSEVRLHLEHAKVCGLTDEHPILEFLRRKEVVGELWEKKANEIFEAKVKNLRELDSFADLPSAHPVDASVLAKILAIRAKAKELERQAKYLMFPEGTKRTKLADAQRLIAKAEKDYDIPAVTELRRVLDFAVDLESRCEAVLNKKHPQSESESVFDAVRKWRAYADEHLVNKFHLPQYEMLKSQLDQHDKWYNRLPFPKPRRDHVELLYKDVADCTRAEDDAAPTEEYCTCICTLPVRPPPPGTVSDAVQCDHCLARFHPQCAGGSCPFCDYHHWNGSLHRTRYYHSFDVLACVRPVPDLTRNYSRLWKQIEFIATRLARLQNIITHFLAFAAQSSNQRPEIIPQVRHYMRKLFRIQLAISPKPNVSYGLDLSGLHRILASQKKAKRRKRGRFVFKQESEKVAPDGTQCLCRNNYIPMRADRDSVKCLNCTKTFHSPCVYLQSNGSAPTEWICPICTTKKGKTYRGVEVRVKAPDDNPFDGIFVDYKKTLEMNRDLVKVSMGEPNGPFIILDVIQFFPAEDSHNVQSSLPPLPGPASHATYQPSTSFSHQTTPTWTPSDMPLQSSRIQTPTSGSMQTNTLPAIIAIPASSLNDREAIQSLQKKRKASMELIPGDEKRRKPDLLPPPVPLNRNPRDLFDLTVDEALPLTSSPRPDRPT